MVKKSIKEEIVTLEMMYEALKAINNKLDRIEQRLEKIEKPWPYPLYTNSPPSIPYTVTCHDTSSLPISTTST